MYAGRSIRSSGSRAPFRPIPSLQRRKQFCGRHAKAERETSNNIEAWTTTSPFYLAHVRPVKTRALGELFLGQIRRIAQFANPSAERGAEVLHASNAVDN